MIVINLFGGPGVGKSTVAAGLFYRLKQAGFNAELVTEYAKDLTWESREEALQNQPSVLGEQHARLWRLRDKVDVVVTDSPLLLTVFYNQGRWTTLPALAEELHHSYESINFLLERDPDIPYDPRGRNQGTLSMAEEIDRGLEEMLRTRGIKFDFVPVKDTLGRHADRVSWLSMQVKSCFDIV